jgi:hypothetical protein
MATIHRVASARRTGSSEAIAGIVADPGGTLAAMDERAACELLKRRFEAAGYQIHENVPFDEDGIAFELDGFDPARRVGYEYVSEEAGDSWDVGDEVVAELARRCQAGELFVLVVDQARAPDAITLGAMADAFLGEIANRLADPDDSDDETDATDDDTDAADTLPKAKKAKKPAAKKPAARKPAKKPAAKTKKKS